MTDTTAAYREAEVRVQRDVELDLLRRYLAWAIDLLIAYTHEDNDGGTPAPVVQFLATVATGREAPQ